MTKGFVIGATGSGTGKTTVSLAIMAYLASRGIKVAPFKVGPDFIDPGFHTQVSGSVSYNLDSWMLPKSYNKDLFSRKSKGKELSVVEGVMGLFDGYDPLTEIGSTAQMAKILNLPVLLIVSAKGKARSAAAIVKGFETFDPDLNLAGVIFTQAGSQRHYEYLRQAVDQTCTTPCLGYMPKNEKIVMPERHLGLVTADEAGISDQTLSILTSMVNDHVDMERLLSSLRDQDDEYLPLKEKSREDLTPRTQPRIAVARDRAFCFYYPDNIDLLRSAGAKIIYFSPLEADELPEDIDGIYFGGGYPELNSDQLSSRKNLLKEIQKASLSGMPIYGECGGFMYLCNSLSGVEGERDHKMCGIFDFRVEMASRLRSLGYREITLLEDTLIGKKGDKIRGHEFHYSSLTHEEKNQAKNLYQVASRQGQDINLKGFQENNTLGSYLHVHFASNPDTAGHFVNHCAAYRSQRQEKSGE